MRHALLALLPLLAACYSQEEFIVDENDAICGWYERCDFLGTLGFADKADCVSELDAWDLEDPPECGDFDGGAAQACVEGYANLSCASDGTPSVPADCEDVCPGD